MFSLEVLILVGVVVFCIGGLAGAIISRSLLPPQNQRGLEEQLDASRQELAQYQQHVAQHFAETSQLVNNLTQSYREVHQHLAQGATALTNAEISQKMLNAGDTTGQEQEDALAETTYEPPRDWAPKRPGQTGTLSEEFGLNDVQDEQAVESTTAKHPHKDHYPNP